MKDDTKYITVHIRMNDKEKNTIKKRADLAGKNFSEFIRMSAMGCEIREKADKEFSSTMKKQMRDFIRTLCELERLLYNKDFIDEIKQFIKIDGCEDMINIKKDVVSLAVSGINLRGLRIIQDGLILGKVKKKFEPSPQLALSFGRNEFSSMVDFAEDDVEVIKYLKGETIQTDSTLKGWGLVTVDGYPLGWCKGNGNGMLKNKYYTGWRLL